MIYPFLEWIALAYAFLNLWIFWQLSRSHPSLPPQELPKVSVLICARNEEENLAPCLNSILQQDYPSEFFEIWVADDRSTDQTPHILAEFQLNYPNKIHILSISECPAGMSPKKHALTQLISHTSDEIILNTDADCILPPKWISKMTQEFDPTTQMVLGRSDFAPPKAGSRLFWGFQALDFLSHGVVAAAGVEGKIAINSTGNSLAYRKSAYEQIHGFQSLSHIISGDDDLLYHKFFKAFPQGIRFCYDSKAAAQTTAPIDFKGFWEQRKRWASKTVYYNAPTIVLLSCVFAFYLSILILPLLGLILQNGTMIQTGLYLGLIKFIFDGVALIKGMQRFGRLDLIKYYPITALLHTPYIVGAALLGVLGKFTWKDGAVSRKN